MPINTPDLLYPVPNLPRPRPRRPNPVAKEQLDVLAADFTAFWEAYPRKEGKKYARELFAEQVRGGADPKAIVATARSFQQYCIDTGRERKFIRLATRWLNEKPWERGLPFADYTPPRLKTPSRVHPDPLPRENRTPKQRAELIAQAYCIVQPLSSLRAIKHVVEKAIAAGRWTDVEIRQALGRLAAVDRKVTEETLRTELLYRISEHRMRAQRGEPKTGTVVYLVKADESPLVKIGTSEESLTRLYSLQLSCPVELKILHEIPGSYELENALHHEFRSRRRHGEWFDFSDVDPVETVLRRLPHVLRKLEAVSTPAPKEES